MTGIDKLMQDLQYNNRRLKRETKFKLYAVLTYGISAIFSIFIFLYVLNQNIFLALLLGLTSYIPIVEIVIKTVNTILSKTVKPKLIPKMDFLNGIPKEYATFVVIPTVINNEKKVKVLIRKLEVFYLANKSPNLYFAVLGDCTTSPKQSEPIDEKIINIAKREIDNLNNKYKNDFPIFHFVYRKRLWNNKEKAYLGWERKRGLLNQFNEYLLGNSENQFLLNTLENTDIPDIKYVITLDSDTNLVLNSGLELVGAMAHILNRPEIDEKKNVVTSGYGIIQPRVGVNLIDANRSVFAKIFAGLPGIDAYANAISDVYQDNFDEGIFTGKGIYDLQVFSKVLKNRMPENRILSHDLLEGSYLRCALATDIVLIDGTPTKYSSWSSRLHRWIRGDWQIINWLSSKVPIASTKTEKNPLNLLSKFKIIDNLRRSLVEISLILSLLILAIIFTIYNIKIWFITAGLFLSVFIPIIIDVVIKEEYLPRQKTFTPYITGIKGSFIASIINLSTMPYKAYKSADAIIRAIYRQCVSKQNLLEWTTSEEVEKNANTDIVSYFKNMIVNTISGLITLAYLIFVPFNIGTVIMEFIAILWIIAPFIAWYISIENIDINKYELLSKENKEYILDLGKKTWEFFSEYMNEENNYLPPDNYQEDRKEKVMKRTSSTNIGLGLLAVVSAFDLNYINLDNAISLLYKTVNTIFNLEKWNGHLYNWYDTKTLKPLFPRYISVVDNGNFIGYLYTLKQFLIRVIQNEKKDSLNNKLAKEMLEKCNQIINETNFADLYDEEKGIFSIGYNVEENKLTDSYYDLLASEARQASLIAIAKKDIPAKHWNNLSRTLTSLNGYKGLVSWAGTAFEYLMPNINIKRYPGSLLDESCKFLVLSQKEYSRKLGIPWGTSESAFNLKDLNSNYQYKAFGIPWLGLKRGLGDEKIITPYASILALPDEPEEVIENIKKIEDKKMLGKYGLYEALDYTPERLRANARQMPVKTYMAHHQALILLSINNLVNNNVLQKRFMHNPEIEAVDILLQERMPINVITTKERKEKVEELKYIDYEPYSERVYNSLNPYITNINVISNDNYTICINDRGEGLSKYKNAIINKFKQTDDYMQGIFFYIKDVKKQKTWNLARKNVEKNEKYEVQFMPDSSRFIQEIDGIRTNLKIGISPDEPVEIRSLEIENTGEEELILEISSMLEPVLSRKEQDYAHPAFNKLFLKTEYLNDTDSILVKRKARGKEEELFLGVNLYTEAETIGDLEYEIDRCKLLGRGNINIPDMIESSKPFSRYIGIIPDQSIALRRTIKIPSGEKAKLNLLIAISNIEEKIEENISKYKNEEEINRAFEISKIKVEEEARYLGIKGKEIEKYQKILSYLLFQNNSKKLYINDVLKDCTFKQCDLWKYGISGDVPILLVKIKDVNDIYVVEDLLKAYEYFRIKNIKIDFVILNEEENIYEKYVKEEIERKIQNRQLAYLQNAKGGIYILNSKEIEDEELLEFKANLIIDASKGNVKSILEYMEKDYINSIENISDLPIVEDKEQIETTGKTLETEKLKYYNEYGGFSEDGKEYLIRINKNSKLPTTWSHVISNENFGTVLTENMGGFTWSKNSRLNRLSAWNNNPVQEIPSEIIYLKDIRNGKAWSLGAMPMPDDNDYFVKYGFGYAKFEHISDNIIQTSEVFVPLEDSVKINIIKLKNLLPEKRNLKIVYYIKPVLGEDEINTTGNIILKKDGNSIKIENKYEDEMKKNIAFVSSSEVIKSYTGSKKSFIGNGDISNPEGLNKVKLDNENGFGETTCVAMEIDLELDEFESKEFILMLGEAESNTEIIKYIDKYKDLEESKKTLQGVKQYWFDKLNTVQIKTPVESINIMLNGWATYQTIACRLWARSGFYQSGGAFGFRDQLQDTLGIKYLDADLMKKQILKHASHQFIEGDVEHWWHEETGKGIRTKFSDDLLWLVYVLEEYINYTNDYEILEEKIPYIEGIVLGEGVDEHYTIHPKSEIEENLYMHCIRAIEKALNFGDNGLPKIGSGDWNDGFSTVGNKGVGESIWLGFFLYNVLERFNPICECKKDVERVVKYKQIMRGLKQALNTSGWDGRWFRRAYTDERKNNR